MPRSLTLLSSPTHLQLVQLGQHAQLNGAAPRAGLCNHGQVLAGRAAQHGLGVGLGLAEQRCHHALALARGRLGREHALRQVRHAGKQAVAVALDGDSRHWQRGRRRVHARLHRGARGERAQQQRARLGQQGCGREAREQREVGRGQREGGGNERAQASEGGGGGVQRDHVRLGAVLGVVRELEADGGGGGGGGRGGRHGTEPSHSRAKITATVAAPCGRVSLHGPNFAVARGLAVGRWGARPRGPATQHTPPGPGWRSRPATLVTLAATASEPWLP